MISLARIYRGLGSLLVIEPEGHGVADKVLGSGFKTELGVDFLHGAFVDIETYLSASVHPWRDRQLRALARDSP
jgi:hypothetical protein